METWCAVVVIQAFLKLLILPVQCWRENSNKDFFLEANLARMKKYSHFKAALVSASALTSVAGNIKNVFIKLFN